MAITNGDCPRRLGPAACAMGPWPSSVGAYDATWKTALRAASTFCEMRTYVGRTRGPRRGAAGRLLPPPRGVSLLCASGRTVTNGRPSGGLAASFGGHGRCRAPRAAPARGRDRGAPGRDQVPFIKEKSYVTTIATDELKKHRGFASMTPDPHREIASKANRRLEGDPIRRIARAAPSDRQPPSPLPATETKVPA